MSLLSLASAALASSYVNETYGYPDGVGALIIEGPFPYKNGPSTWSDENRWGAYGLIDIPGVPSQDGKCPPVPADSPFATSSTVRPVPMTNGLHDCMLGCNISAVGATGVDPCHAGSGFAGTIMSCFDVGPGMAGGYGVCAYNCSAFQSAHKDKRVPCGKDDIGKGLCSIFCDPRALPTSPKPKATRQVARIAQAPTVSRTAANHDDVLFAFTGGDYDGWQTWDWESMTHLGFWTKPSDEVRDKAQQHSVKLFADAHLPDKGDWTDAAKRTAFAAAKAQQVKDDRLDGVFFDYEGNFLSKAQRAGYTLLAEAVAAALRPLGAKIMVCVGGRPTYELRDYDYAGLANASDFLFIMGYDLHLYDDYTCFSTTQGNVCSPAEASIRSLTAGVEEYLQDVHASKLVLGLPWYGQRYVQLGMPINYGQIDYKDVLAAFDAGIVYKKAMDRDSQSWKIDCHSDCLPGKTGKTVWYDDATTLDPKFKLAGQHGLRGVGMWNVNKLPAPTSAGVDPHSAERTAMWAAIRGWRNVTSSSLGAHPHHVPATPPLSAKLLQSSQNIVDPSRTNPDRLQPYDIIFNASSSTRPDAPTVVVSTADARQPIVGFGGAITDAVAHVFSSMPKSLQKEVVEAFWGKSGQKYNMARLTIGATDFSTTVYNYNDHEDDFAMEHFSVDHDKDQILPLARLAAQTARGAGESLEFLSSPWSPPGWMKPGWLTMKGYMRNSAKPGMLDDDKVYAAYSLYTSKYLTEYKEHGINVSRITIQNEPDSADHMVVATYPACNFDGKGEGEYLRKYLGPQIRKDHPSVQIYVHDGQKYHDVPIRTRVEQILAAAGHSASAGANGGANSNGSYIDGVAFHWYGKNLDNYQYLGDLARAHPELKLLGTEATLQDPRTQGSDTWGKAQMYGIDIIGDLNNGAEGWIEWNVLLDSSGGPTCIGPTVTTVCVPEIGHCDAPILYSAHNNKLTYRDTYHIMAHFSRYIRRGSRVVKTSIQMPKSSAPESNASGGFPPRDPPKEPLDVVAVSDPEGENQLVIVVLNPSKTDEVVYKLDIGGGRIAALSAPPRTIQTILVPKAA